jgi:hypothetical protein
MDTLLRKIKRCCIEGRVRFTLKAECEMLADHLTRTDVLEAILNAPGIYKVIRSRSRKRRQPGEKLCVILGFTYDNLLVYTKGKLLKEGGAEFYYILISAKRAE